MSVPLLPPPYDQLGHRAFSFYPAIVGIEHNEWRLRKATWSEFQVLNTKSEEEIWISRRFLGEISRTEEPVMIVGLNREVELRAGQIVPHVRKVIEMPRAVNDFPRTAAEPPISPTAPVIGIRLNSGTESRVGRLIVGVILTAIIGCVLLVVFFRSGREHVSYAPVLQSDLGLSGQDDYFAVVRKLGQPADDQWKAANGEMQYRVLRYPARRISVILMGSDRDRALYIGAFDQNWRPVNAVTLPGGKDTYPLLRSIRPPV
ncbi:MAG: hypothetical protein H7Y20_19685 [Bryobacteraceae bacterium]|nr:hypothetical protein [Bryobacteraceae bacterium]